MLPMLEWLAVQPEIPALPPVAALEVARELPGQPWVGKDLVQEALGRTVPWLGSRAFLVGDVATGDILTAHHADQMLPIASLTKIMTVAVALERYKPDDLVTITEEAFNVEGAKVPLLLGDRVTVQELVTACIVRSGNDAAVALAAHAPGGTAQFVGWMNEKAVVLGLKGTHFANPMGFDAPDHFGTAADLFTLVRYTLETHPQLRTVAPLTETQVRGAMKMYTIRSTNELLGDSVLQVLGLKTGTTEGAGQSLITLIKTPDGRELLSVMLGSSNRFAETKMLLWWLMQDGTF